MAEEFGHVYSEGLETLTGRGSIDEGGRLTDESVGPTAADAEEGRAATARIEPEGPAAAAADAAGQDGPGPGPGSPGKAAPREHWRDESEFRKVEMETRTKIRNRRREVKDSNSGAAKGQVASAGTGFSNDLFLSHCWRGKDTQLRKRELVAGLNDPKFQDPTDETAGFAYWGDFLDLQQDGPVAWRKEIEDGIKTAAKVVALIDAHYLHSFNCIQELAFCFKYGKPVVPIILDQRAWEILTSISGAEQAYTGIMHDAAGYPLSTLQDQEGQPIMEGQPLDLKWLTNLFAKLSSINFCPCREADFINFGRDGMMEMMLKFVKKDITYLKEHNELQRRADLWMARGGTSRSSALLSGKDINMWSQWVTNAIKYETSPPPTPLQQQYVRKSRSKKAMQKRLLILVVSVAMATIIGLAVWAGIAAKQALDAKALADEQKQIAEANAIYAQEQQLIAEKNEAAAIASETKATMMLLLQASPLSTPAEARAVAEAVEIATATGAKSMAQPALYDILKNLQERPFWLMGQVTGPSEGYSLQSLAWSQDVSAPLLAGGFFTNGSVAVWTDPMGAPEAYQLLPSHSLQPVSSLAWATAPDLILGAQVLASGHDDGVVTLWLVTAGGELSRIEEFAKLPDVEGGLSLVSWQPGAPARLAVGSMSSFSVWVYSYPDLQLVQELTHGSSVSSVAYGPGDLEGDSRLLAVGLQSGDVVVWDLSQAAAELETGPPTVQLTNMTAVAFSLAWTKLVLAVGSHDVQGLTNSITIWKVPPPLAATNATEEEDPSVLAIIDCGAMVNSLSWSTAEVPKLGAALDDGSLYAWPIPIVQEGTAATTPEFAVGTKAISLTSVVFSPVGGIMASAPYGSGLSDVDQGALALSLWRLAPVIPPIAQSRLVDEAGAVLVYADFSEARLSWGARGSAAMVAAHVNGFAYDGSGWTTVVSLFSVADPTKMTTVASWAIPSYTNSLALGGGEDGGLLALGSTDSENATITLYNNLDAPLGNGAAAPSAYAVCVEPQGGSITALAWSQPLAEGPEGVLLASGSTSGAVSLWQQQPQGGAPTRSLLATHTATYPGSNEATAFAVTSVAWAKDGLLASAAKDGSTKVYLDPLATGGSEVLSLQPVGPLPAFNLPTPVNSLSWSASGHLAIATGLSGSGTVQVWELSSSNVLTLAFRFDVLTAVRTLAWATDGRLLVGLEDGSVRISVVDDATSPVWVINQDASTTGSLPAASSVGFSEDDGAIGVVFSNGAVTTVAASFDTYVRAIGSITVGELSADDLQQLGMPFVAPTLGIDLQ